MEKGTRKWNECRLLQNTSVEGSVESEKDERYIV